jgi:hypothetical protein
VLVAVELAFVVDAFVSVGMLVVATGGVGGGVVDGVVWWLMYRTVGCARNAAMWYSIFYEAN